MQREMDEAPWEAKIEYIDDCWPFRFAVKITHGWFQYGPDGGPFLTVTYKGAKRLAERVLRQKRRAQALKLGYAEVQLNSQSDWELAFERLSR